MKKSAPGSLRALLTEAAPIRHLPAGVIRQLVGYYGDWRHSRDILNDAGEWLPRIFKRAGIPNSSRSFHAQ